jgi:hypothetical protein
MAFLAKDRTKAESVLSALTTTLDAVGRSKRDIDLMLKLNPHWPEGLRGAWNDYLNVLNGALYNATTYQDLVIDELNSILPPGGSGE